MPVLPKRHKRVADMARLKRFAKMAYFGNFWRIVRTGGSCLIIGSAAGVAAMGMEKIPFMWYLKKITWLALSGYLAGAAVYVAIEMFVR